MFPFAIKTRRNQIMFFAESREERDILVHELNAICQQNNDEVL